MEIEIPATDPEVRKRAVEALQRDYPEIGKKYAKWYEPAFSKVIHDFALIASWDEALAPTKICRTTQT